MFRFVTILALGLLSSGYCDTNYRLNTPVEPSSYSLLITPFFDTKDAKAFTFDAEVTITFTTENSTSVIKLHSEDLDFNPANITISNENGNNIALDKTEPLIFDKKYTFAYINLASELQVGVAYVLKIEYTGPIREDLKGFYRNYYYEKGVKKWLGATQMEPTNARKVFPCFDEPQLKAKFTISIIRPGSFEPSLANTEMQNSVVLPDGNNVLETFYPTPKMSTYLVAFLVSEFKVAANTTFESRGFGVYTRPEARNQSKYAFEVGTKVVKALGEFLGIDYYSTDLNLKLDHVALPDFSAGAMENWGLIKYREALLLYVPEVSTPYYKYRVAQIVAHETTHMWFGNLVTCHWWSNTWLNEGFANYFQDYITSLVEPSVGSAEALVTGSVYSGLDADESVQSQPISNPNVNSPKEISNHFGTVSYQKAGSVIRMIHHLLGDDAFKFGLNYYLNTNKFSSGYPDLMYDALEHGVNSSNAFASYPGFNITEVMGSWISQAGHPIVKVDVDYTSGTVKLTQKRFYTDPSQETDELYKIPITYTTEMNPDFSKTKPVFIMDAETYTFNVANLSDSQPWILLNIQETGLYRVDYDRHSWSIISNALKGEKRVLIHHLNRAKIVNDLFAYYFAEEETFELLHDVLEFLKQETDYSVWLAAVRNMEKLRNKYLGNSALKEIETYFLTLMEPILENLGYSVGTNEDISKLRNRMQILEFACKIGHQGCLDKTADLFKNLKQNGEEVSPSLRPVVYCSGLQRGDQEDYDFLWQRMKTTNVANEARIIADALACSSSEDRLKSYLLSMLEEDSPIRTQDLTVPLAGVLSTYNNVNLVLEGLKQNFTLWNTIYGSMDSVLVSIASALHSNEDYTEFESILSSCLQCSDEELSQARSSLALARKASQWAEDHKTDLLKSLRNTAITKLPKMVLLVTAILVASFVF